MTEIAAPAIPFRNRHQLLFSLLLAIAIIGTVVLLSALADETALRSNGATRKLPPSLAHPFGTDWLGRDMFTRTVKGLQLSLSVGLFAALVSVALATLLGVCAAVLGRTADAIISWFIDLFIGMPHLVFMILIAFIVGGGIHGIILAVSLTHWTALARLIRAEVLQVKNAEFILVSRQFGRSWWFIAWRHVLPHILPQAIVGFLLMFPHIILHEAALTFLGFGFSPQTPAVGILLAEAMTHISTGTWWLVFFPGIALLLVVKSFDTFGEKARIVLDPATANR